VPEFGYILAAASPGLAAHMRSEPGRLGHLFELLDGPVWLGRDWARNIEDRAAQDT